MRRAVVFAVLPLAGCLSTPGPAAVDARDDVDAPAQTVCRVPPRAAGTAWPPAGITVREVRGADVDADGQRDLVVTVAPDGAAQAGPSRVYVLYGPVDHRAPQYHAVLDVGAAAEIEAWGSSLDDLDGDGCLDLTVAGPPIVGRETGAVAIWRHGRGADPWQGTPARAAISSLGAQAPLGPVLPVWADLTANPARDLIVTQLQAVELFTGPPTTAGATFSGQTVAPPTGCNDWDNINGVLTQPASGLDGAERLHVFGHYKQTVVSVTSATPTAVATCPATTGPIARAVSVVEASGLAPKDLIVGGREQISARLLNGVAAPVTPVAGADLCMPPRMDADGDFNIQGLAAGELDGTSLPEVVVIDHDAQAGRSYACLVNLDRIDVTGLRRNGASELMLGTGVARAVAIDTLGGGREAWVIDADGAVHCLRQAVGGTALESCP